MDRNYLILFFGLLHRSAYFETNKPFEDTVQRMNQLLTQSMHPHLTEDEKLKIHDCFDEIWLLLKQGGYTEKELKQLGITGKFDV